MPGVLSSLPKYTGALPYIYSVDGRKIGPGHYAPTVSEISRGLGKLCRFAGNVRVFWPVLLHSMVVADLVGQDVELYALLHDAAEVVFNDTPTPFKPAFFDAREHAVLHDVFDSLGVPQPTPDIWKRVKVADVAALHAEAFVVGPRGLADLLGERETHTEFLVKNYLREYTLQDYITEGRATVDFENRVLAAAARLREGA